MSTNLQRSLLLLLLVLNSPHSPLFSNSLQTNREHLVILVNRRVHIRSLRCQLLVVAASIATAHLTLVVLVLRIQSFDFRRF